MAGFGSESYGSDSYGGGSSSLELTGAFALDTHTVRVTMSALALAESGFAVGDAMNPSTWTIERLDTGEDFTVLAVRMVMADTLDITVLQPFASVMVTHRVSSTTLLSPVGVLIGPVNQFDFLGVLDADFAKPVAATSARRYPDRDIANPPFPSGDNSIAGGFVTTSSGDVALEEGAALIRKLIIRRLTTPKGGFFHLPNYGLGISVKEPVQGTGDMVRFKQRVEKELGSEPEIDVIGVAIEQRPDVGVLIVRVQVKLKQTGQVIDVESVQR